MLIDPALVWPVLTAPFVGSFLGVLIARLPAQDSMPGGSTLSGSSLWGRIVFSRSACPECGTRLTAIDLVPLASYLMLRGRCRHCGQPIGWLHPAVEIAAVVVALWATLTDPDPGGLWIDCGIGWTLLTLAWIDCTDLLLPDVLTLPLLLAGLAMAWFWRPDELVDHCLAAIVAYLSFQGLGIAYRLLRGWDGLGGGDAKLLAAAGAWVGLAALPLIVLASALFGLLAALGIALRGRTMTSRTQIPFGPCIAFAFWLVWLYKGPAQALIQLLGRQ